jgi:peptide/nickel transport system ATP-binding protein
VSDAFSTLEAEAEELARILRRQASAPARVPQPPGPPLIEVENLQVRFGREGPPVIRGISFAVRRGECLALVGESGSGKSVTARTLVGLAGRGARTSADRLSFAGESLIGWSEKQWHSLRGSRVGFVMQDALGSLDPLRTVGSEIAESLRLHTPLNREQRAARVIELLRSVEVSEPEMRARQYPHQLSGGFRQRALIASAIACGPELLIADEPTTALDAVVQAKVLDLLASLRTPTNAMIIVSHDFAVVSRLADRVAVMHQGFIVEQGSVEGILGNPQHPYTRSLIEAVKFVHGRGRHASAKARAARVPEKADPVLAVEGLSKAFTRPDGQKRAVVSNLSFVLRSGETLGIVGESGSGKTTAIRMALGLETPDAGVVLLQGRDWRTLSPAEQRNARRQMQVVFQDPIGSFDPRYTVERVLGEAIELAGITRSELRRARSLELIELVRLEPSVLTRRPVELSGGQRQRLAIARALAPKPAILVCDEPVSALDVSVQRQILALLEDLKARLGLACLFISHDLGIIQRISDRVLVMRDGSVVETGDVEAIFTAPAHPYTQELLAAIPILQFAGNAIDI